MEPGYSAPVSSDPSVLYMSGRSDGGANSTFVAKSSGKAVVSVQGRCIEDLNATNGTCLVLEITVS